MPHSQSWHTTRCHTTRDVWTYTSHTTRIWHTILYLRVHTHAHHTIEGKQTRAHMAHYACVCTRFDPHKEGVLVHGTLYLLGLLCGDRDVCTQMCDTIHICAHPHATPFRKHKDEHTWHTIHVSHHTLMTPYTPYTYTTPYTYATHAPPFRKQKTSTHTPMAEYTRHGRCMEYPTH